MIGVVIAGLLAGYGIALPVGGVGAYLVALTARTSLKIGVCAGLGVATADGLYALIATFGGSTLAPVIRPAMVPLNWAAVLVLVALATRSTAVAISQYRARRTTTGSESTPIGPARAYLELLGMTLLNPATVIYFAALVLGSPATVNRNQVESAGFVLAAFAASASWQIFLAGGGALLGRLLTGAPGRLATAIISSALIIALALRNRP